SSSGRLIAVSATVAGLVLALDLVWPFFLSATLGLPLPARIVCSVVLLAPIGLAMGMPYPLGLQAVSGRDAAGLPWVWAVIGAASVLGSILAFALAIVLGFQNVLLIGAACYVLAALCATKLRPEEEPVVAEPEAKMAVLDAGIPS